MESPRNDGEGVCADYADLVPCGAPVRETFAEMMSRGGRLLAFFVVAARFAIGPERWWCLDRARSRFRLRPCRGASPPRSGARADPRAGWRRGGCHPTGWSSRYVPYGRIVGLPRCLCTWVEPDAALVGGAGYALFVLVTPRVGTT